MIVSRRPATRVPCLIAYSILLLSASAQLPPRRATVFDGSAAAQVRFPAAVYAPSNSMTLEAWIHREDAGRCETMVAQNFTSSFWFGFCAERLRFYRQGGSPIDATRNVPARRWTHVAVVYDRAAPTGSNTVTFYIDGTPAGGAEVRPATSPLALPLYLGASPGSLVTSYPLRGALDEVRIWSVARTADQIRNHRFREASREPGLVALFPGGGTREMVSGAEATQAGGSNPQIAGILPRDLIVPRSLTPVTFDGQVTDVAYAEAEALVVRYPNGAEDFDVPVRLLYAPSVGSFTPDLFVSVPSLPSFTAGTLLNATPQWRVYVDRARGESAPPATNDLRFSYDAYGTQALASSAGTGTGTFAGTNAAPGRLTARTQSGIEFDAPSVELRFASGTILPPAPSTNGVGFMMDVHEPFRTILLPGFTRASPFDAVAGDTTTWPEIRLGATLGGVARVSFAVVVRNPDRDNAPLDGARIAVFNANDQTLITRTATTFETGRYGLRLDVPTNTPVRIQLELPAGWRFADPAQVAPGSPAPLATGVATVDFPGCPRACDYPEVTFHAVDPPATGDTAVFTGVEPAVAESAVLLRESPQLALPAGTTAVRGTRFDRGIQVWTVLESSTCGSAPGAGDGDPRDNFPGCDWRLITPLTRSSTEIRFQIPYTNAVHRDVRVWLHDTWSSRWLSSPSPRVRLVEPPYPQVHGLAFENYPDGHDIDDYRVAFPGVVCDPFRMVGFWAFFPIYLDLLEGEGECVGMVTSTHFLRTTLDPATLVRGVFKGAGFMADDNRVPRFDVSNVCAPRPTSLRAVIRGNHGTQTSSQFLGETLSQLQFGISGGFGADAAEWGGRGFGFYTPMNDRLNQIRRAPLNQVVCIKPDLLGSGHALQPLRIRDTATDSLKEVDVYDPNHPGETRVLRVNTALDRFAYDGFETPWKGAYLFVHDIPRFWTGGRDVISIDTLGTAIDRFGVRGLLELLAVLVSGQAEPQLTFPNGTEWGWRPDRTPVATATNVAEIPNFGQLLRPIDPLGHGPAQAFLNPFQSLPTLDIHARGDRYSLQLAQGGNLFQVLAGGRRTGDRDRLRFLHATDFLRPGTPGSPALPASETLHGFLFQPARAGAPFTPRIALGRGGSNTLALFSWSGLEALPAGASVRFGADTTRLGAVLVNDSATPLRPTLSILTPPAPGVLQPLSNSVALPALPAGAAIGSYLLGTTPGRAPRLRFELDRDRDRRPDLQWIVAPEVPPEPGTPTLRAARAGDRIVLSWPVSSAAWWLTSAEDLGGPWTPSTATAEFTADGVSVSIPTSGTSRQFFRLTNATGP